MARPRKAVPGIRVEVSLAPTLVARMDLLLFSPLESKVPQGARAEFITCAIKEKLSTRQALLPLSDEELAK